MAIQLYEINHAYIDYLSPYAPHLFHNKQPFQQHERKYIGILLKVNHMHYFAPLSSFKPKHKKMEESLDLIKLKNYAVININNMFPVPEGQYTYVNISNETDFRYRTLLLSEYRIIKKLQDRIQKNAAIVYRHKLEKGTSTPLAKRCNDFISLENACKNFYF